MAARACVNTYAPVYRSMLGNQVTGLVPRDPPFLRPRVEGARHVFTPRIHNSTKATCSLPYIRLLRRACIISLDIVLFSHTPQRLRSQLSVLGIQPLIYLVFPTYASNL